MKFGKMITFSLTMSCQRSIDLFYKAKIFTKSDEFKFVGYRDFIIFIK